MPERGWDAVTVPGCVSLWQSLSADFGKLPFERLFEPKVPGFPKARLNDIASVAART